MTQRLELYKCRICQNLVEVINSGEGTLVCCDESMKHLEEHQADSANPHFAHLENIDEITKKIYFNHVSTPEHHFEFIEVISNDKKYVKRKFIEPLEANEITFKCDCSGGFYVRLHCNVDGAWVTKFE